MHESTLNAASDNSELGYGQLFAILMQRRFTLISVFIVVILVSLVLSLRKESTYRSSLQFLVEPSSEQTPEARGGALTGTLLAEPAALEIDYATQIRLMQSPILVERAVETLQVDYPNITVEQIRSGLAVDRVLETEDEVETKILQVDYTDSDPQKTQRVLEVMKDVYLRYNAEQQEFRLQNGLDFINQQIPSARAEVASAEQLLKSFREENGVVDPQQQADALIDSLNAISTERQAIRADYQEAEAQLENLQQQLERSPESALIASRLSESARFQSLLDEYQQTELTMAQQLTSYTPQSPIVRAAQRELDNQQELVRQEAQRILGDIIDQTGLSDEDLFATAQLGGIDLGLVRQLVDTQTVLSGLQSRDQSLAATETRLQASLDQFPDLIQTYNQLLPNITVKQETLERLLAARQEVGLEIGRGAYNWQVVESSSLGGKVGPNLKVDLLLGAVLGLFVATLAAFAREALDNRIHSESGIEKSVSLPVLGTVPGLPASLKGTSSAGGGSLTLTPALKATSWLPFREALDFIYQGIQAKPRSTVKSIAVTSASANEGKALISIGLAFSASRLNQKVLLIDTNLRSPILHKGLALSNEEGLSTLLGGKDDSPKLHTLNSQIEVLTAGPVPDDPVRLLNSRAMRSWMDVFEKDYDFIVVNTPPLLSVVDAIQAASLCHTSVLVAKLHHTIQADLIQAVTMLQETDLLGIIANGVKGIESKQTVQYTDLFSTPRQQPRKTLVE